MNVNDMIDTILNFDLDVVLAGLNESSHHLSQMEFVSLIVITVGAVLLCLTGLKLVRFLLITSVHFTFPLTSYSSPLKIEEKCYC